MTIYSAEKDHCSHALIMTFLTFMRLADNDIHAVYSADFK